MIYFRRPLATVVFFFGLIPFLIGAGFMRLGIALDPALEDLL
jgi:hypothetical protein